MILKNINKPGFTLIELVVVITIIMIISISLFEPYHYYQKKVKIKLATKDISQSLYDARNMAINGISSIGTGNLSVGVYLGSSNGNNNKIKFFSYPYTASGTDIEKAENSVKNIKLIKEITLEPGIQINSISGSTQKNDGLFFFNSITGSGEFYSFDGLKNNIYAPKIKIDISYMGANPLSGLNKSIYYYTKTNIVDDN